MTIVFVITSLAGGGAEKILAWLANSSFRLDHRVAVITLVGGEPDRHALDQGIERISFHSSMGSGVKRNISWVTKLRVAIRDAHADLVVSFFDQVNILVLLATRGLNIPVVVSERTDPRSGELRPVFRPIRLAAYHKADALVVQTVEVRRWFATRGLGAHAYVIPNPVILRTQPVRVASRDRKRTVITIGRLVPEKQHDVLIEAFACVAQSFPDWQLVIYGDGSEYSRLQKLIVSKRLDDRAHLAGRIDGSDAALAGAEMFVLSSRHEGSPNALLEAMAYGVPVVSFDCESGPRNLIRHGIDGLLVETLNVQGLANALRTLMSSAHLRASLAARALEVRERFSETRVLTAWQNLFANVVTARGRAY